MTTSSLIQPARVWLRRGSLDRSLAAGTDPAASPELERRARQLASARFRAGDELKPRGIALVERLLTDGGSALYSEGNLHEELGRARAALHLD
jgi:hypothetical protein